METLTSGELFAGYGGLARAVEIAFGAETRWVAEWDDAPSKILAARFDGCPNFRDVTAVDWYGVESVDVLSGGSPCQDVSAAGRRAGMSEGTRSNLWVAMREAIRVTRPKFVVWENVRGAYSARAASASDPAHPHQEELDALTGRIADLEDELGLADNEDALKDGDPSSEEYRRGIERLAELEKFQTPLRLRALGRVLGDLASLGYQAEWRGLKAADIGAPHARYRVFVLASLEEHATPAGWPVAEWDADGDVWRSPDEDIFGETEIYTDTFPTSGAMRGGMIYARPAWEAGQTVDPEALFRTPCAAEAGGGPLSPEVAAARGQTLRLTGQVIDHFHPGQLARLPEGSLLGTPRCADGVMQDLRHSENITNPRGRLEDMVALLPTPAANVADNGGSQDPDKRRAGNHSISIQDVAEHRLLPSPVASPSGNSPEDHLRKKPGRTVVTDLAILTEHGLLETGGTLMPTPRASDGSHGGPGQRDSRGGLALPSAAHSLMPTPTTQPETGNGHARNLGREAKGLIPTPRAQNGETRNNNIRSRPAGEPQNIENALAVTVPQDQAQDVNWGPYLTAIRRWEQIVGRAAPAPTEPTGRDGRHRLSAYFVEWMMGLPAGWVTGLIGHEDEERRITRNEALKALGNGVVPAQAAAALLDMRVALAA